MALLAGLLALGLAVRASDARAEGKSAVLVLDANTGRVLHESAADAPRHPASLAKMMTLYIVFELMEQGRLSAETKIKMSANAVAAAPSKLDLDEGEEISLVDAIRALITKSANDVAVAVAEHIAGSEEKFARLMTQKARQLGMAATTFRNASGLPDDEQLSTARDMATLALRLQDDFPRQYPFFATRAFTYKDETFRNHNTLLFHYPGTDGLKTGYTRASGFNLVASVRRGGKHVIGVVFGGASAASRNAAMRTFLSAGLVKASSEKTRKPAASLVARAKRAPERKIAAVPAPQRAERAAPKALAPAAPAPAAASSEPPAAPPPPSPAVEVARVRQVLVAPLAAAEPAGEPPPHSIEALLEASGPAGDTDAAPIPPSQRLRWVSANAGGSRVHVAATAAERPVAAPDTADARAPAPSTLDAQAANLARSEPPVETPPPALVRPPAAAPAPPALASGFHIQIGAYQSEADAQRQLALVRERAAAVVSARTPVTQQVKQGDKLFYRARYAGFEAHTAAAQACSEIKRLKLDCIVLKAE